MKTKKIKPIKSNKTEFKIHNEGFSVSHPDLKEGQNVSRQTLQDMMNATGELFNKLRKNNE